MARCGWAECGRWRPDTLARRSGAALDEAWFCSAACVERAVASRLRDQGRREPAPPRALPPLKVGLQLVHQGALTPEGLRQALGTQRQSGLRLGEQVVAMGLATRADVLRALAAQQSVPFLTHLEPAALTRAPRLLGVAAVRALGLVPFEGDGEARRVKVACVAPVPRLALAALRELTGWTPEPFLVADDLMRQLVHAYGEADARPMPDIAAAAARIARAVAVERRLRMAQASCDPFVWVRLEGARHTEDLLVRAASPAGV